MIPEAGNEQARPDLKAGRAYLKLAITDKNGVTRVVDCEADITPPRVHMNEEPRGPFGPATPHNLYEDI